MKLAAFHPKMTAGVFGGAIATIVIAELNRRGVTIDGTEGASIAVVIAGVCGYFMPNDDAQTPSVPISTNPPTAQTLGLNR